MNTIVMQKVIKINMLSYFTLCWVISLFGSVEATTIEDVEGTPADYICIFPRTSDKDGLGEEKTDEALDRTFKARPMCLGSGTECPQMLALTTYDRCKYFFVRKCLFLDNKIPKKTNQIDCRMLKSPLPSSILSKVLLFAGCECELIVKRHSLREYVSNYLSYAPMGRDDEDQEMIDRASLKKKRPRMALIVRKKAAVSPSLGDQPQTVNLRTRAKRVRCDSYPKSITLFCKKEPPNTTGQLKKPDGLIDVVIIKDKRNTVPLSSSSKKLLNYRLQDIKCDPPVDSPCAIMVTQSPTPDMLPAKEYMASYHSDEDQVDQVIKQNKARSEITGAVSLPAGYMDTSIQPREQTLPLGQLLIPANGQCLYTAIIMGYLLPVRKQEDKVTKRIAQLFGHPPAHYLKQLYQVLQNPTDYLTYLRSNDFSTLVTAFTDLMQIKKETWGGSQEIQTIATKLKVNIQEYYPAPDNRTSLLRSDLTKPSQANADITIHIVRDRVHPAEVRTETQKASAKDNLHYQHYRLKDTFFYPIPIHRSSSQPLSGLNEKGWLPKRKPYSVEWFEAAKSGNEKLLVKLYNTYNINVKTKSTRGHTALHFSAKRGHLNCVKYLVQQGADMNDSDRDGNTALLWSAQEGHLACVKYLVQQGAHIHVTDKYSHTPLHSSAQEGKLNCIKYLLQQGADINTRDKYSNTALLLSAQDGHIDCLKYLLQQGADIKTQNKQGNTVLLLSAQKGHLECVKYILQQGADVNTKNIQGSTALLLSTRTGQLACVKFLISQGADVHHKNKDANNALLLSAYKGYVDCLKYLLQQGADIDVRNKKGSTALLLSARGGHLDCVEYLLQQGADINVSNAQGNTALLLSAYKGHLSCLKCLVEEDADVYLRNMRGSTALLLSAQQGHLDCIKHLVEAGAANVNDEDKYRNRALHWSAQKGHVDCLRYLLQQGADTDARDNLGSTALIRGACEGKLDCLKLLVQYGANVNAKNSWKNTALILSSSRGHLDCVKFLMQNGADISLKGAGTINALKWAKIWNKHQVVSFLSDY